MYFGFANWITNSKYTPESEYDYYEGKVAGDIISTIASISSTTIGTKTITDSVMTGGIIAVGSVGTFSVAGGTISIVGVVAGAVMVTYGGITLSISGYNLNNDYKKLNNTAKETKTSQCFTEETLINTENGYKKIKDIKVGDKVLSENDKTGEKGYKEVKRVFENETDVLVHIYVSDDEIKTTENHPFYVVDKGWTSAENLKAGDNLKLANGKIMQIEYIEREICDNTVKVYNFEVENWHTYFITESCILVHNDCWGRGNFSSQKASLQNHYSKHGAEVGAKDIDDYVRKANAFKKTVKEKKIKGVRVSGYTDDVYRYKFNGKYIDIHETTGDIISFGKQ